jgi:hypothetical protein
MKKQIIKEAAKATLGSAVIIAHLAKFAHRMPASEFMRLLCRILGVGLPLPAAVAIRIILLAGSGYAAIDGIRKVSPALYKWIKSKSSKDETTSDSE